MLEQEKQKVTASVAHAAALQVLPLKHCRCERRLYQFLRDKNNTSNIRVTVAITKGNVLVATLLHLIHSLNKKGGNSTSNVI